MRNRNVTPTSINRGLTVVVLNAFTAVPPGFHGAMTQTTTPQARTFLFSWGIFADPVFDRDVVTFKRAFNRAYDTPVKTELYGYASPRLSNPDLAGVFFRIFDR
jgi:hypothetical protein